MLDTPNGQWLVEVLRAAKAWGRAPRELLGVPGAKWGNVDSMLSLALERYEATRVGSYGFPKRLTEGPWEGWFEVETTQDNAQLALDMWRKDNKDLPAGYVPKLVFTGNEVEK